MVTSVEALRSSGGFVYIFLPQLHKLQTTVAREELSINTEETRAFGRTWRR